MNKKFKIIFLIILIIILAVLVFVRVWGYKREIEYQGDTIRIGVSLPLTFEGVSFFAEGALGGVRLAQKEINEKGGVLGKQVELIIKDDSCEDREKSFEVWDKLIKEDRVISILGPICTMVAEEVFPLAQENKIPVIMGGDSVPWLARSGDYIFNAYPTDILNGKFVADYIFTELNKKKVAVIYEESDEKGFIYHFIERFGRYKELGAEIVFNETFPADIDNLNKKLTENGERTKEMIRIKVDEIKKSGAEVIVFYLCRDIGYDVMSAIKEADLDVVVFGPEVILTYPEFEGALFSVPKINNPSDFQDKINEIYKENISFITPIYYDALYILSQAIERAGKLDRELIRNELAKTSYKGIAFPIIEFDEYGDLKEADFEVMVIKGGKSEVYTIEE